MSRLLPGHRIILAALERHRVDYVVIGGIALQIHGTNHVTNDVDVAVAIDEGNQRRIDAALQDLNARPGQPGQLGQSFTTPHGRLELLSNTSSVGHFEMWARRARIEEIDGIRVRVGDPDDVLRAKEATDRPKDRQVLPRLRAELLRSGRLDPDQIRGEVAELDTISEPPGYLVAILGTRPVGRAGDLWDMAATRIAEHRQRWDITDDEHALGPHPADPQERADRDALKRSLQRSLRLIERADRPSNLGVDR